MGFWTKWCLSVLPSLSLPGYLRSAPEGSQRLSVSCGHCESEHRGAGPPPPLPSPWLTPPIPGVPLSACGEGPSGREKAQGADGLDC